MNKCKKCYYWDNGFCRYHGMNAKTVIKQAWCYSFRKRQRLNTKEVQQIMRAARNR